MKTRNFFIYALFIAMCFQPLAAQGVAVGPRLSLNFTSYLGELGAFEGLSVEKSGGTAFQAGGTIRFRLSKRFAFQPEILYSQQIAKETLRSDPELVIPVTAPIFAGEVQNVYTIAYLKVPLLVKYYITNAVGKGLHVQLGPQVGHSLQREYTREFPEDSGIENVTFSNPKTDPVGNVLAESDDLGNGLLNSFDVGILLGVGYDFLNTKVGSFSIDLRYDIGISRIINSRLNFVPYREATYTNSVLSFSAAYFFDIKSKKNTAKETNVIY